MIFHENRLPADDYHEISCLIRHFGKSGKISHCCLLQIVGGALRVKLSASLCLSPASLFWKPVLNNNEKKCSRLNWS